MDPSEALQNCSEAFFKVQKRSWDRSFNVGVMLGFLGLY